MQKCKPISSPISTDSPGILCQTFRIAEYFAKVSGYRIEETPAASGYAGYKDWFINFYDRPGYTIEAGLGENPLPVEQFSKIYKDNVGILLGGMTELE